MCLKKFAKENVVFRMIELGWILALFLKTQEISHEKQMQPESKVNFSGEIFTGIEIMNSSVKSSALTEESLILY